MASHSRDWPDEAGPIPADLATPDDAPDPTWLVEEVLDFAERSGVKIDEAIVMLDDADSAEPGAWRIYDENDAEWALRLVAEAGAEIAALQARAKAWAERIQLWFDQASRELTDRVELFSAHLEWYARTEREAHGHKTVTLPSGRLSTRLVPQAVEVADETAVVEWARKHLPRVLRVREDVLPSVLADDKAVSIVEVVDRAAIVLSTGELIDWQRHDDATCPKVGDGWPNPEEAVIVAQVTIVEAHEEVRHGSVRVDGVRVRPERVSVTIKAGES